MNDLTVLFLTVNKLPDHWSEFQIKMLLLAIGDTPIVSISRKPMDLGHNIVEPDSGCNKYWNIYKAMYTAAIMAKTPYVAMAEDDVLYPPEHFNQFRPPMDTISYNRARWSLFSWHPIYCLRQRISNCTMIGPRELIIRALEERFQKWPDGAPNDRTGEIGRPIIERRLGVTKNKMVEWYSTIQVVHLNHPQGIDEAQQQQWKKHGQIMALDIPYWGKSEDIASIYHGIKPSSSFHPTTIPRYRRRR